MPWLAIGTDGARPVVWGMGETLTEARRDAHNRGTDLEVTGVGKCSRATADRVDIGEISCTTLGLQVRCDRYGQPIAFDDPTIGAMGARQRVPVTKQEITSEIHNASIGRIMRDTSYSDFKLVVVLGAGRNDKIRVCPWSAVGRYFSGPQGRHAKYLTPIDLDQVTKGQKAAVRQAISAIEKNLGSVTWGRSLATTDSARVGKPWLSKATTKTAPADGVTRLTTATLSSRESKP